MAIDNRYLMQAMIRPSFMRDFSEWTKLTVEKFCLLVMEQAGSLLPPLNQSERDMARKLVHQTVIDNMAMEQVDDQHRLVLRISGKLIRATADRYHLPLVEYEYRPAEAEWCGAQPTTWAHVIDLLCVAVADLTYPPEAHDAWRSAT